MTLKEKYDKVIYETGIEEGLTPLLSSFMVAQANHESASYTSDVFERCNNGYGYKYVGQALATACSKAPEDSLHYAKYESVADSAREVARWIKRRMSQFENVKTPEEYAIVLEKNGYFGGNLSIYQNAMNKFWYPIKGMMNVALNKYPTETLLTGVTFFSLLGFYLFKMRKK